jgi:NDP-sugar pyrophosphorylase family protein/aminoglycoside phosphotransferase
MQRDLKVLLTTSGIGSRLGDFTQFTNKSLVRLGNKPAISHIIDAYPTETRFVVTLGHFGSHVREYLQIAYPNRFFEFIEIEIYEGPGSSLGYSMLQAKHLLQQPFIFHASDAIISHDNIPFPDENWVGGCKRENSSQYSSFDEVSGYVNQFHDKGELKFDFLHIGVIGIHTFKEFWDSLQAQIDLNPNSEHINDVSALQVLLQDNLKLKVVEFKTWYDVGNIDSLNEARRNYPEEFDVLEKKDESIFFIDNNVVKFFANTEICSNRVLRATVLNEVVPSITRSNQHFYSYAFIQGKRFSNLVNSANFKDLLYWSKKNLWNTKTELEESEFEALCDDFYKEKTLHRVRKYLEDNGVTDSKTRINGIEVPEIFELLNSVNYSELSKGIQSRIHGDLILDNIILDEELKFKFVDWRQDFAGNIEVGDLYYDLAKLNHSTYVNNECVVDNLFEVSFRNEEIHCEIYRKNTMVECQIALESFIEMNNLDPKRVRIITSLIWLNMSALHSYPLNRFLFYFGKYNLWKELS